MQPTKLFPLIALLSGSSVFAKDAPSHVVKLSKDNYKDIIGSSEPVLVEFFAPWCGHCKNLAPEFESAAKTLQPEKIKLAAVDCTVESDICTQNGIRGYPTLAVFQDGKEVSKYQGQREADAIVKFMKKQASPAISKLTGEDDLKSFKEKDDFVVVGFFENTKSDAADVFAKVAEKLRQEFSFAVIGSIPSGYKQGEIVVFKKFDEPEVRFTEAANMESLSAFVLRESIPLTAEIGPDNYSKYADAGIPLAYFFYADEKQREQYTPAVKAAAKAVKGKVHTVFINGATFGQHAEVLNLPQEWPAFSIHDMEKDLKYPLAKGDKMSAESLTKHLESFVKGTLKPMYKSEAIPKEDKSQVLRTLVHDNFDKVVFDKSKDVLVEIYAPWCGACKRIAPEYEELAKAVPGDKVVIAKYNGVANDIPASLNFKLSHFPTFKLIKSGNNEVIDFEGDLSFNALAEFLETKAGHKVVIERKKERPAASTEATEEGEEMEEMGEEEDHVEL